MKIITEGDMAYFLTENDILIGHLIDENIPVNFTKKDTDYDSDQIHMDYKLFKKREEIYELQRERSYKKRYGHILFSFCILKILFDQ